MRLQAESLRYHLFMQSCPAIVFSGILSLVRVSENIGYFCPMIRPDSLFDCLLSLPAEYPL